MTLAEIELNLWHCRSKGNTAAWHGPGAISHSALVLQGEKMEKQEEKKKKKNKITY